MKLDEAKERYIQAWGTLGSSWGINRTMAQIHALLLVSTEPLSTEDIMEQLKISRGNANMNIRTLMDWGLASKIIKQGERKDFFITDKDIWELGKQVAKERKRRELDPILKLLEDIEEIEGSGKEVDEFRKVTGDLNKFAKQSASILDTFANSKQNWFFKLITKIKV
ncbi:MAG: transcriptional regulator [Cytophagales bacterium]|nr:transcriptional regulator [Cytophagales bacterium]